MRHFLKLFMMLMLIAGARAAAAQAPAYGLLPAGGAGGWLNVTRPLTADDLKGRLVLLDFWTYGCINCMQIVPDLEYLEHTFGDRLLVIGVHSAKFDGEKGNERILAAAQRFGLKHPVVNDSDFAIWRASGVRAWPTQLLLDGNGQEIGRYVGEGHRDEIERDIRAALGKAPTPAPMPDTAALVAATPDTGALSFPARLAFAASTPWGPVTFIADAGHNRVVAIDDDGTIRATIGGGARGLRDGSFDTAQFNNPRGMAYVDGALYIADTGNHVLRRADLAAGQVVTVAGTGKQGRDRRIRNRPALKTAMASPWDIEPIEGGKRFAVAMAGTHQLWAYDPAQDTVTVLAGSGAENIDDGIAARATLAQPSGLSHAAGGLYFADAESSALRLLTPQGTVKTLVGTGLFDFGHADGPYPQAMMQHPQGLYADGDKIWIADTYNNALRVYDAASGMLSTVSLPGAALAEPGDVIVRGTAVWIADTNNHAIRRFDTATGKAVTITIKNP